MNCSSCNSQSLTLQKRACSADGYIYRCIFCLKYKSIIKVINVNLPKICVSKLLHAAYYYSRNILDYDVCGMVEITDKSYLIIKKALVESASSFRQQNIKLGGIGSFVQVDETACNRKKSCYDPQTNEVFVRNTQWVIGILCETSGEVKMEVLPDRKVDSIYNFLRRNVREGTIIKTDGYPSYPQAVSQNDCEHLVVNHQSGFISPLGVHTNGIESIWSGLKKEIKKRGGVNYQKLSEFVKEYLLKLKIKNRKDKKKFNQNFELLIKNL